MEIRLTERRTPPEWALWERRLLDSMGALARDFVRRYTRPDGTLVWLERAEANGGILPDNVGENGIVGEHIAGKWYGGYYGWRWPHGFMTLIEPAVIAASNAFLLTGDESHLKLPRQMLDHLFEQGKMD